MKNLFLKIAFMILPVTFYGQNITSSVVSSAGDDFITSNLSLSVTIGEPVIDNYTSELYKLNTGFQQGIGNRNIALSFFLEGFYNGTDMNQVFDENGAVYPVGISDKYQLQIAKNTAPYTLLYSDTNALVQTSGKSFVKIPAKFTGNNYFVIKHRNHIETWSSSPVSFAGDTVNYDFTNAATKAFGDNLKEIVTGVFAIYTGDVNQDGLVDGSDMSDTETDNNNFVTGYVVTDVNGDGLVDGSDMSLVETANNNFVSAVSP